MTKGYLMNSLVEKMQSPDQDFRFMGLNDLMNEIKADPGSFQGDESAENKVIGQVLTLVEDKISEVKNQAVKCLGQLIKIIKQAQMERVVDKLIEFSGGKEEELRDISGLALKTICAETSPENQIAKGLCDKLTPKILEQIQSPTTPAEALVEHLSILSIIVSRFSPILAQAPLNPQPLTVLSPLLSHPRPVVRKRTILTLSQFVPISPPALFSDLLTTQILPNLAPDANVEKQKTTIGLVAAVARQSPAQIAGGLQEIVPKVLGAVKRDDEELREASLLALEALVLRCPNETTPFLSAILGVGCEYIKYDPNYAGGDDEDEEMADPDDDEDDDDADLDEYSDDEDTSYKIRRSSVKLLSAVISTRPELLATIYKDVSPVLISRFGDREESVRLEVWAAYGQLLGQTGIYGGLSQRAVADGETVKGQTGKRKRDAGDGETMDVVSPSSEGEGSPYALLKAQVPSLAKALLSQIKSAKTPQNTLQAAFHLLHSLLDVLPGCLSGQTAQILATSKTVLGNSAAASTSSALPITCLSFLALFFGTHPPTSFSSNLSTIMPVLSKAVDERHPRVSAEAFRVFSALLNALRPIAPGSSEASWVEALYDSAVTRLSKSDTDPEVRAAAEEVVADLWICAPEIVGAKGSGGAGGRGKEWDAMWRTSGRTEGAVKVVTKVAQADGAKMGDAWVNGSVEWLLELLKKGGRSGKGEVFVCLDVLLRSYSGGVPADLSPSLVPQIKPYLSTADIPLLSQSLTTLAILLTAAPKEAFPEVERDLLPTFYPLTHSPLLSGSSLDALLSFVGALVTADNQIASHLVPNMVKSLEKAVSSSAAATASAAPGQSQGSRAGEGWSEANVARCVAQAVRSSQGVAAGVIAEYHKNFKKGSKAKTPTVVLSLLIVGELGRFLDMSNQQDIFAAVLDRFSSDSEEIRSAAAFAAGNIAIGNLHAFLSPLVSLTSSTSPGDAKKRLLALHALKEVVTHCSHAQLEGVADVLWAPLFANSENAEESMRNVAASCLGKLATTGPSKYLPQLHARIRDDKPATRATVVSAIRYTFSDTTRSYDDLLAPLIVDFLALITDPDLTVRRLALSSLNSAARTKPQLIKEHLASLQPALYKETVVNEKLIRTVQMGPWTHKVDDGLDARKTAYETMYTLLDTCLTRLDLRTFLSRVIPGLSDDSDEVKVINHMMLFRLSQVAPAAAAQCLDEATSVLEKTMKGATVTKDTVKQDLERAAELQRSALRAVVALSKVGGGVSPKFDAFVEEVRKSSNWGGEFKELAGH